VFVPEPAARRAIERIDDEAYTDLASTLSFHSPLVDRYLKAVEVANAMSPDTLYSLQNGVTSIMPCGALLPLEPSALASTIVIRLLTGLRVYIVYPPTQHNVAVLDGYFQAVGLGKNPQRNHTKVCQALQGGITFLQRPGATVTIPPWCPTVVFAAKTSAAVSTRSRCKQGLTMRLRYVSGLVSQIMAIQHVREEEVATALEFHLVQLYKDLSVVLGSPDSLTSSNDSILALGAAWEDAGPQFLDLVESFASKPLREYIFENIPKLWNFSVQRHGLDVCPVCCGEIDEHG
jgi:hypothetical protein